MKPFLILVVGVSFFNETLLAQVQGPEWTFEEEFQVSPASPSQDALSRRFEYVATHRTHPQEHFTKDFDPFLADHGNNCSGPASSTARFPQHLVSTTQDSDSDNPDPSFFICRNHMMSSMGEVAAYSNSLFWPRQEFDFSEGGVLEFEVNINEGHTQRHWWEILIAPRDQIKFASAPRNSAVDETYPRDRIVLDFRENVRQVRIGENEFAPDGWSVENRHFDRFDFYRWRQNYPFDPALDDRRIRRTMRIELKNNQVVWGIETEDGSFDEFVVDIPEGLPFTRGLVQFKTHAYTPAGSGNNFDIYTFHWDNIRFTGPQLPPYQAHRANDVVYLERNGNRPIGDTQSVTIELPDNFDRNPVLVGQLNGAIRGQPLVSVNGGPDIPVNIDLYRVNNCVSGQWRDWISFRLPLNASQLKSGTNVLQWKVGPRPACANNDFWWDGFSAKFIHIQTDGNPGSISTNSTNIGWIVPIIKTVFSNDER